MAEVVLQLCGVQKAFGGLDVCRDVDMKLKEGELHALIGPNGAGKTTLLNLISGLLPVDSGTISFKGDNITDKTVNVRAQLGMTRSFQVTSLFQGFTVQQNIALAVQAKQGSGYRFWKRVDNDRSLQEPVIGVMEQMGLLERAETVAANLSHGEQRLLEIGMALATKPDLLLLDEPMAGLGPGSSRGLAELVGSIKSTVTILLVEHDMQAVFTLADTLTVLVQGTVVATGTPEEIRKNQVVQEAYLGT